MTAPWDKEKCLNASLHLKAPEIDRLCDKYKADVVMIQEVDKMLLGCSNNSGYGAAVVSPVQLKAMYTCAGESNYAAEMEVIRNALEHIKQRIEEGTAASANVIL